MAKKATKKLYEREARKAQRELTNKTRQRRKPSEEVEILKQITESQTY